MRLLILLFAISRLAASLPYRGVTVGITPYSGPVQSLYQAQDVHGQYVYGYATPLSAQEEAKTADGVTRGGYSYIDANGILQTVKYISDPVNGFRVLATNIPRDLPEVEHARAQHLAAFEYIKAEHALIVAKNRHAAISPLPVAGSIVVPVRTAPVAVVAPSITAPVAPVLPVAHAAAYTPVLSSQYHAQDTLGQYTYGYTDPLSSKSETKTADGVTRGGYSYIDANGILQSVQYISDPVNGFRVSATNLPQAPSVTLIGPKVSATVVGPKEQSVVQVAASAPANTNVVSLVQSPIVVADEIVPNANIPIDGPQQTHYIHSNPNNQPSVVYGNPQLGPPFNDAPHGHNDQSLYGPPPPHHVGVSHGNGPILTGAPALDDGHHIAYSPEHIPLEQLPPHQGHALNYAPDQAVYAHPDQQAIAVEQILAQQGHPHGIPSEGNHGLYGQPGALLVSVEKAPAHYGLPNGNPTEYQQAVYAQQAADAIAVQHSHGVPAEHSQALYTYPAGEAISAEQLAALHGHPQGIPAQAIYAHPSGEAIAVQQHQGHPQGIPAEHSQAVYAQQTADALSVQQLHGNPIDNNRALYTNPGAEAIPAEQHAAHYSNPHGPSGHLVDPNSLPDASHYSHGSSEATRFQLGPINGDYSNHGPVNQQQVAVAYDTSAYGQQPTAGYGGPEGQASLFVPDGTQQVHPGTQGPHNLYYPSPEEQPASSPVPAAEGAQENQPSASYTTNIKY